VIALLAHPDPVQHLAFAALCLAATGAFARRWSSDARRSAAALWWWAIAVVGALGATVPAVESWAQRSFTGHMVQHLVLISIVAPALVIAVGPLMRSRRRGRRHWQRTVVDGPWVAPAAALAFVGVLLVTHLTGIYDTALRSRFLHEGEHVAYLVTAALLWAALREGATRRHAAAPFARIAAILGVIAGTAILGLVLATASEPLISTYSARNGFDRALDDQRTAAALMWIGGMMTSLPLLVLAFWRWAVHEEATARRLEQLTDNAASRPGSGGDRPRISCDVPNGRRAAS
jgi:putative membrane protein